MRRAAHPMALLAATLIAAAALLFGCTDDITIDPPERDGESMLAALELNDVDLEGVDLEAIQARLDRDIIVEAVKNIDRAPAASEPDGPTLGKHAFDEPGAAIQAALAAARSGGRY